jgi:hypothetical protein
MNEFVAYYESRAKVDALVGADCEEYANEALENPKARERAKFKTLAEAEAWASKAVREAQTVFGAASIDEIEEIPQRNRCRHCDCRGWQAVRHYIVEDDGIVDDEATDSRCAD